MSATSHTPKDAKVMAAILKDCGVNEYEPRVINQMLEFAYRYVCDLLEDSKVYSDYAGKKQIDVDDVKLAIQLKVYKTDKVDNTFTSPPPRELILDIAKEKNSQPLPALKQQSGLRLPPDRYCLTQPNYRLKAGLQHTLVAPSETKPPARFQPSGISTSIVKKEPPTTVATVVKKEPPTSLAFEKKAPPSFLHPVQSAPSLVQAVQPPRPSAPLPPTPVVAATTTSGEQSIVVSNPVQTGPAITAAAVGKPLFRLVSGAEPAGSTSTSTVASVKRKFEQLDEDYDNI